MRIGIMLAALLLAGGVAQAQVPPPRIVAAGEACNGTVWPPILCAEGLQCQLPPQPPGQPPMTGVGGICRPSATPPTAPPALPVGGAQGDSCNMAVFPARGCSAGLTCRVPPPLPGRPPMAGASGVCLP